MLRLLVLLVIKVIAVCSCKDGFTFHLPVNLVSLDGQVNVED